MMLDPQTVGGDTAVLPSFLPVPGVGVLPINAFVIRGQEPVLIDTGIAGLREDFLKCLRAAIDPAEIRWIWLTHIDPDHVGNLAQVLAEAPRATVVTSFVGLAKLSLLGHQLERFHLLNPGQTLDIGDRKLFAVTPPTFDAPETTGFFDPSTRTLFSSDSFGALMAEPAETAPGLAPDALRDGLVTWSTIDAPWIHSIQPEAFSRKLKTIGDLGAETLLSSHLPPAPGMTATLLDYMAQVPRANPFVGMDQAAFESLMAEAAKG